MEDISKIQFICETVCDYFRIPNESIHIKTRKREIVQARQIAMFFSKSMTESSLATIGSQIGKKDHATVLHACKTVNNIIDTDKQFRTDIEKIEKKISESDFSKLMLKYMENTMWINAYHNC